MRELEGCRGDFATVMLFAISASGKSIDFTRQKIALGGTTSGNGEYVESALVSANCPMTKSYFSEATNT